MKIAIYHNLKSGGALVQLEKLVEFSKRENEVHIFSPNNTLCNIRQISHHLYKTSFPDKLLPSLSFAMHELAKINKDIANDILSNNFDIIYVFPCFITQSPDILRFLKKSNVIYFFAERKREFYEKTSFDHFSAKRIIARFIRSPLFFKDKMNCMSAKTIIANSIYSKNILKKTYGRDSVVIYPGLKQITPTVIQVKNTDKVIIVGQLSYTKGYDLAFKLLSKSGYKKVSIIGRKTDDYDDIDRLSRQEGIKVNLIETENDRLKNLQLQKHGVFIACQRNEPFGIATLEACYNNIMVFGLNEGGTAEIIHHGLNGFLFDQNDIKKVSKLLSKVRKLKKIKLTKLNSIDWELMTKKIITLTP